MPKVILLFLLLNLFFSSISHAEDGFKWPNKAKAAIALTYDDALDSQLNTSIPQLDKAGLKGTFYISPASQNIDERMNEWKNAAANGHELGNHLLHHPCRKSKANNWVKDDYDLTKYSLERYVNEILVANALLKAIDGKNNRSFAYTCGHTTVGEDTSVVEALKPLFPAARGVFSDAFNDPSNMNYYNLYAADGTAKTAEQLISEAEKAKASNKFVAFLFHGVGGDHLSVDSDAHKAFVRYLSKHKEDYWVAPLVEIVDYIKKSDKS